LFIRRPSLLLGRSMTQTIGSQWFKSKNWEFILTYNRLSFTLNPLRLLLSCSNLLGFILLNYSSKLFTVRINWFTLLLSVWLDLTFYFCRYLFHQYISICYSSEWNHKFLKVLLILLRIILSTLFLKIFKFSFYLWRLVPFLTYLLRILSDTLDLFSRALFSNKKGIRWCWALGGTLN
jgi:hypothetical protein